MRNFMDIADVMAKDDLHRSYLDAYMKWRESPDDPVIVAEYEERKAAYEGSKQPLAESAIRKAAEIIAVGDHLDLSKGKWYGNAHHPETFDDIVPIRDALDILVPKYEKLFTGGSAALERIMLLSPEKAEQIKPGDRLGIYWATSAEQLETDAIYAGQNDDSADQPMYLFKAVVPITSVDWVQTLAANTSLPWEFEVCLKEGTPLHLTSVVGGETVHYAYDLSGKAALPHLWGKEMRA